MLNRMFFAQNISNIPTPIIGTYGYLYNSFAVNDVNFCPAGWHVPSQAEYITLSNFIGGTTVAGGILKETGTTHWASPNTGATNDYLFSAIPGGYRYNGIFDGLGLAGVYRTSDSLLAILAYNSASIDLTNSAVDTYGYSVRLVKDDSVNPFTMLDYDGNNYPTVAIGNQVWLAQNWKCTRYNEGTLIPNITDTFSWTTLSTGARCAYDNNESYV